MPNILFIIHTFLKRLQSRSWIITEEEKRIENPFTANLFSSCKEYNILLNDILILCPSPISSPDVHLFLHLILVSLMSRSESRDRMNENNCFASLPWWTSWGVRGDRGPQSLYKNHIRSQLQVKLFSKVGNNPFI